MSDYVTPESDFTRVHRITASGNGPFGKRVDETEYALMIGGVIVTDDDGNPVAFPTKREAYAYALRRFPTAMPDYLHRRVTRDPWFTTTTTGTCEP